MDTAQQALFRAMLTGDWFCESYGDVESPTGYFGWMTNSKYDNLTETNPEFMSFFGDTISTYGMPEQSEIVGNWVVVIDSNGTIYIHKMDSIGEARRVYRAKVAEYNRFTENVGE